MPTSRPIRCQRLYRQAYRPEGSVRTPYSVKQRRMYSVSPSNDHPHAKADIIGQRLPVALQRGHHFDLALVVELPAFLAGPHDRRQVVDARGRVRQPIGRWGQPGGVAHCRAFDGRLRAIQERVEHLGVQAADLRLLRSQAVVTPHRLGGGLGVMRQPLVPAPGGDDGEAGRRGPSPRDHRSSAGWSP